MILCFIGALSIRNNITDLWLMIGFGVVGYVFERLRFPIAPLVLGVILGPLAEEAFMNSMISFQQRLDGVLHAPHRRLRDGIHGTGPAASALSKLAGQAACKRRAVNRLRECGFMNCFPLASLM